MTDGFSDKKNNNNNNKSQDGREEEMDISFGMEPGYLIKMDKEGRMKLVKWATEGKQWENCPSQRRKDPMKELAETLIEQARKEKELVDLINGKTVRGLHRVESAPITKPMSVKKKEEKDLDDLIDKCSKGTAEVQGALLDLVGTTPKSEASPSSPSYEQLGIEVGELVGQKNRAYGDSFNKTGDFLKLLYPNGIKPEQYTDALCIVRIYDKLMRIATNKDALGESPYRDIAGYALLGMKNTEDRKKNKGTP